MDKIYVITEEKLWNQVLDLRESNKDNSLLINDPEEYFDHNFHEFEIFCGNKLKHKSALNSMILIDKVETLNGLHMSINGKKLHIDNLSRGSKAIIGLDHVISTKQGIIYFNAKLLGWNSLRLLFRLITLSGRSEDVIVYVGNRIWCVDPNEDELQLKPVGNYEIVRNLVTNETYPYMKYLVNKSLRERVRLSPFECKIHMKIVDAIRDQLFLQCNTPDNIHGLTVIVGDDGQHVRKFINNFQGIKLSSVREINDKGPYLVMNELSKEDAKLISLCNRDVVVMNPNKELLFGLNNIAKITEDGNVSYIFKDVWEKMSDVDRLLYTNRPSWSYEFETLSKFQSDVYENWDKLSDNERLKRYGVIIQENKVCREDKLTSLFKED